MRGGGVGSGLLRLRTQLRGLWLRHLRLEHDEEQETDRLDAEGRRRQRVASAVAGVLSGEEVQVAEGGIVERGHHGERHGGRTKREGSQKSHYGLDVGAADLVPRRAKDDKKAEEADHAERFSSLETGADVRALADLRVVDTLRVVGVPAVVAQTPQCVARTIVVNTRVLIVEALPVAQHQLAKWSTAGEEGQREEGGDAQDARTDVRSVILLVEGLLLAHGCWCVKKDVVLCVCLHGRKEERKTTTKKSGRPFFTSSISVCLSCN